MDSQGSGQPPLNEICKVMLCDIGQHTPAVHAHPLQASIPGQLQDVTVR